jgi:pimeloyl-ACP methyl ester carboxylesterase
MANYELHSDSHAYGNGTEVVWALPKGLPVLGVLLLAHACKQSPKVWFPAGEKCLKCVPRPEEMCMSQKALAAGYAVIAISNVKGTKGCWERDDVANVQRTLSRWRAKKGLARNTSSLYVVGVGSGGWFAAQTARVWPDVRAVSIQASVPSIKEVQRAPAIGEATAKAFPPMQMLLMQRDTAKQEAAQQLLSQEWAGKASAELLKSMPKKLTATFFSDGIPGLARNVSELVRAALVKSGYVDAKTSMVTKMPVRSDLRAVVSKAMGDRKNDFPQRSKQLAMEAIFARFDLAYGNEASTCEHMDKTLAFFQRFPGHVTHLVAKQKSGNGTHSHNGTHHHSHSSHHTHSSHLAHGTSHGSTHGISHAHTHGHSTTKSGEKLSKSSATASSQATAMASSQGTATSSSPSPPAKRTGLLAWLTGR